MNGRLKESLLVGILATGVSAEVNCGYYDPSWLFNNATSVSEIDFRHWDSLRIHANDAAVQIEDVENLQSKPVGLKRLFIANSADAAMILTFAVWDPSKVNVSADNTFYFQNYFPNFSPLDTSPESQFLDKGISANMRQNFLGLARRSMPPEIANGYIRDFSFGLRKRPKSGEPQVLIIRTYSLKGERNISYIKTQLVFERGLEIPVVK